MSFIGRVFSSSWMSFVCDVRVWVAQLRYYPAHGRSVVVGCRAAGNVKQLFE